MCRTGGCSRMRLAIRRGSYLLLVSFDGVLLPRTINRPLWPFIEKIQSGSAPSQTASRVQPTKPRSLLHVYPSVPTNGTRFLTNLVPA